LSKRKQASKEPVSHQIVSSDLLCLEVNPSISEKEIVLNIFEDMLPNEKQFFMKIKPYDRVLILSNTVKPILNM
jgi:hypothetical protein